MGQKEELFNDRLKEIFIGEEIQGKSGFANLMRIKSDYFDEIFSQLNEDIDERVSEFEDREEFREELYDKLYTFLKKYFSDSGSIYFTYTPLDSKIYEQVYDNQEDVTLFWKTHMLYYVKTDTIWEELEIKEHEVDGKEYDLKFNVSNMEGKKANEKKDIEFEIKDIRSGQIEFGVSYSSYGMSDNKIDDLRKDLKKEDIEIENQDLADIFSTFRKQNEVDFFINKDAEGFLKEQFDLWLKEYLLDENSVFEEERLKRIKAIRDTAYDIIDFVSQFEDELAKIWNKPKFALDSNYVISIDRIVEREDGWKVLDKLREHEGWRDQVEEWRELGLIGDKDLQIQASQTQIEGRTLNEECRHLPIDTKNFGNLKIEIISLFDSLNSELDGTAIKSDNYQALNTIKSKYGGDIKTAYIDPPYNTEKKEFPFKDNFKSASWLSMMNNRISLSKNMLRDDGALFCSIDENEFANLKLVFDDIFGQENLEAISAWRRRHNQPNDKTKMIAKVSEYVISYSKDSEKLKNKDTFYGVPLSEKRKKAYTNPDDDPNGRWDSKPWAAATGRGGTEYTITTPTGKEYHEVWYGTKETFENMKDEGKVYFPNDGDGKPRVKIYLDEKEEEGQPAHDFWGNERYGSNQKAKERLKELFDDLDVNMDSLHPKPVDLVSNCIRMSSKEGTILDFFAGSGTTGEAVIKRNIEDGSNRKFLLVEMAEYFNTILLPRLKKVSYSLNWDEGQAKDGEGCSIFFKYYEMEQYEQALKKCKYETSKPFDFQGEKIYDEYVFMKDQKMIDTLEIDNKDEKIEIDLTNIYPSVDIAETLSNMKGKKIKQIDKEKVVFQDGETVDFNKIAFEDVKPLIWWN